MDAVNRLISQHRDAASAMRRWVAVVEPVVWRNLAHVRESFPTADGVVLSSGQVVTVFNVRGNTYRFLTSINYASGIVIVLDLLTHAEYDKQKWKGQL